MSLKRTLTGRLVQVLTSKRLRHWQRRRTELMRKITGRAHTVHFYYRPDDPYAVLLTQILPRLTAQFKIDLICHLGPEPDAAAVGNVPQWQAYAVKDAQVLARHHGLTFSDHPAVIDRTNLNRALSALSTQTQSKDFLDTANTLAPKLWRGESLPECNRPAACLTRAEMNRHGHYLNATLCYAGEWYWGLDRIRFLTDRLERLGLGSPGAGELVLPTPNQTSIDEGPSPPLNMYFSFRSPYSYLAIHQIRDFTRAHCAPLVLKPVMPMVTRGVPLRRAKKFYIIRDCARIAHANKIPFGNMRDPLGEGVRRSFAIFVSLPEAKRFAWTLACMQASWAEGIDITSTKGLRTICDRIGLSAADAQHALAHADWQTTANQHRAELTDLGLWGVPSFHWGDTVMWGQDRLPMLTYR